MSHSVFQRMLSYFEQDITRKQVLGGNKVFSPKERLALTVSHTQNCLALLPSFHPWWPRLRLLNYACACSTMLKERGKWLQLRCNIPNILENKRNEWMLKQSLKAFKLFQHRFNILSTFLLFSKMFGMLKRNWSHLPHSFNIVDQAHAQLRRRNHGHHRWKDGNKARQFCMWLVVRANLSFGEITLFPQRTCLRVISCSL